MLMRYPGSATSVSILKTRLLLGYDKVPNADAHIRSNRRGEMYKGFLSHEESIDIRG